MFCKDHVLTRRVIRTGGTAVGTRNRAGVTIAVIVVVIAAIGVGIGLSTVDTANGSKHADLRGNGSVDEAWLTAAGPGDHITLLERGAAVTQAGSSSTADSLGSLIVRNLTPGSDYQWDDETTGQTTRPFSVLAPGQNPAVDSPLYADQSMHQGLNYITMRDGIKLAATVRYPYGETCSAASPLSDGHRVLRVQRGRTHRPHPNVPLRGPPYQVHGLR